MSTIGQVESRLEHKLAKLLTTALQPLVPPDRYRVRVALVNKNQRKKRKSASDAYWSPASGEIRISFEPETKASLAEAATKRTAPQSPTDDDFGPIEIRGEPLSATILRERR